MKKKKNLTYIALTAILAVLTYIFSLNVKDVKAGSGNCIVYQTLEMYAQYIPSGHLI